MHSKILRNYLFQRFFDTLISVAIICVLVAIYINATLPFINTARTTQLAGTFNMARMEATFYHAVHGVWPESRQQAVISLAPIRGHDGAGYDPGVNTLIREGAIDLIFNEKLDGKRMTLRPAVPASDPLGPVCWVNTREKIPDGWIVYGEDHTDIDKRFIHHDLGF